SQARAPIGNRALSHFGHGRVTRLGPIGAQHRGVALGGGGIRGFVLRRALDLEPSAAADGNGRRLIMTAIDSAPALQVKGLTKTYQVFRRGAGMGEALASLWRRKTDKVAAVTDVSFSMRTGEMVGFLGPNGA